MATAAISKPEHKNKKRKKEKAEKAAEEPKAAKAPAAAKVKVPATPEEEARRQKQRECRERALAAREGGKAYVSSYKVRAKKRPQQAQRKFERRQEGLPSKAVRNTERRARKAERAIWPASAAQADDWLRFAEARGSLQHDLAQKEASGEPAGRGPSQLAFGTGAQRRRRRRRRSSRRRR